MKQLLFLLLFPCLALAQYTGNAGQKITLGEQTTADGLVYRGVANDTNVITPFSDTSAYIILDTVNSKFYHYNRTTTYWALAGGSAGGGGTVTSITGGTGLTGGTITTSGTLAADTSFLFTQSDTLSLNLTNRFATKQNNITLTTTGTSGAATLIDATLNIPQYSGGGGISDGDKGDIDVTNSGATWTIDTSAISLSGNKVTGTLPVANGGTNTTTLTANKVMVGNGTNGVLTPNELHWDNSNKILGIGENNPSLFRLNVKSGNNGFSTVFISTDTITTGETYGSVRFVKNIANNGGGNGFQMALLNNINATVEYGYVGAYIIDNNSSSRDGGLLFMVTNNNTIRQEGIRILNDGKVGISTPVPTEKLHVTGNARITAVGTASASNSALYITNTGVLSTNASDVNKKHNVRNLPYGLSTINNLNPVAFEWNETDETDIGFIAQDIESIIPESVITNWDSELIFRQEKIIPVLVKAIQEQQALIKALEQRILTLENK